MNTFPPTEKVQQLVRITSQGVVREAAKGFVIEVLIDPANHTSCRLYDDAIWASSRVGGGLGSNTKRHARAASSRAWNCPASAPSPKKPVGSWPLDSSTAQTV